MSLRSDAASTASSTFMISSANSCIGTAVAVQKTYLATGAWPSENRLQAERIFKDLMQMWARSQNEILAFDLVAGNDGSSLLGN
jgi:hypothetical protein